ncbi:rho GTPase-activating protein 44-like isoform X2 [Babylonia areolata]|uniref:rho GTPase-activating protein 44-like isoform X2 n=1 Tax=Babylonia areolata TaxID=304850 RepID=UPI003FD1D646
MWKKENLRKNFLRVKQFADQNFGRAEKSEVLSEDQQGNERRMEVVRQVTHNLIKKVNGLLEAPPGTDPEKRLKKLPETHLSHTLIESGTLLGTETLLGSICQQCGECEGQLAREELQCELDIEKEVLTPLQVIAEVDIPSIVKLRKQLNKSTLDMDSAKNRFNSAVRQSHVPGANMASAAAKADAVREEYEEACNKVEAIKDNLSIELCNFISKENEHSSRLVALLESQAAYHKKALDIIESMIPKMKSTIEASEMKPVFGMSLEEHLQMTGRDISLVLEACILTLLETGIEEEGLFRIAGGALKLKKLRACFDAHAVDMEEFATDPHTVAGVMKQYLRELPEPMLTFALHSDFMQALQLPQDQRFKALYAAVNKLPPTNYKNVRYLIKFLALLAEKSSINKMTPSNISIVMGPNLLWAKGETAPNMLTAGAVSTIVEALITHADHFFPGELDFHLTGLGRAPPSPSSASPSTKEVESTEDKADVSQEKEEDCESEAVAQPEENSARQLTTWETRDSLNTSQESTTLDLESESSTESSFKGSGPEIDFNVSGGYPPDSPGQERHNNSIMSVSSPCVMTYPSSLGGSVGGGGGGQLVPNNASAAAAEKITAVSPSADSPEGPHTSPKVQRRPSKKPAPPPPPERPYSVAVTASVSKGSGSHNEDKRPSPPERRISTHLERPQCPPPERPSVPPPERPKGPPPVSAGNQHPPGGSGGHHRSSSTGAMCITTEAGPNAGSSSKDSLQAGVGTSLTAGPGNMILSGTSTLGRHSSMRPARPNPPPPPPPVNMHTEETHL